MYYRFSLLYICILFVTIVGCSNWVSNKKSKTKIVIDNDAGGDDAVALFIALLHDKYLDGPEIIGLTTVHGNVKEEQSCINNKRILHLAQREEIPIYRGSKDALVYTREPDDYFGKDGLGDTNESLPEFVSEHSDIAALALIELSKTHEGDLVIVALGPVTNIALAIKLDPKFIGRLKQLYLGAGHLHREIEYNVLMDIEAYKIVMDYSSPDKVTILPYSQTKTFLDISKEWRYEVLGKIENKIITSINKFEKFYLEKNPFWFPLDPALVASVLNEDLIQEVKYTKQTIETCGDNRGLTINEFVDKKDANAKLIYSIDKEAYKSFLIDVFSAELQNTCQSRNDGACN